MWIIFKALIEFVTILLPLYVLFFCHKVCGISTLQPGIVPTPLALEGGSLTRWMARKLPLPLVLSILDDPIFSPFLA